MIPAHLLSWWYGPGWKLHVAKARHRLLRTSQFFSLPLLLPTLFAPYKQISAGAVRGNLTVKWRAFLDRLVSRFVGAFVRLGLLLAGGVSVAVMALAAGIWLLVWPLIPLLPIVLVGLTTAGVHL